MENTVSRVTIERAEYDALNIKIAKLEALVKWYENQLLWAKRRQFGSSSEKVSVNSQQLGLFCETETAPPPERESEEITSRRGKRIGKREKDLDGLQVERLDYELPESERICPQCGDTMRGIGVDARRELKLIPARVIVLEHAAHTYACRRCGNNGNMVPFVKAKAPNALLSGSLASPSLVAHIAAQKYSNAMPLYRLENGFRYEGVNISRQTMSNWVVKCSEVYLEPVYELFKKYLLKEAVLHADETTVQVLREPGRAPQTKSYEWVYRTSGCAGHKIVVYEYKETRKQEHPRAFLKDFKGFLHTDGYPVYHNLPPGITIVGCWSHVRRNYESILKNTPKDKEKDSNAQTGVAYINALFMLEHEFAALTPRERLQKRLEKSKPIADAFFQWAANLGALPKSPLGDAVRYTLSQRIFLENVFLDGRTEISNNRCERSVKPFVMGRKAWLFSNTPAGARASSVMYSIIETAKENGLNPCRYLEFLLETLPSSTTSQLDSFLPWSDTLPQRCRMTPHKENAANA